MGLKIDINNKCFFFFFLWTIINAEISGFALCTKSYVNPLCANQDNPRVVHFPHHSRVILSTDLCGCIGTPSKIRPGPNNLLDLKEKIIGTYNDFLTCGKNMSAHTRLVETTS